VEICEIPEHPWMLGCQFHPEFKSQRLAPLARQAQPEYFGGGLDPARTSTTGG
jgi:CTP synthase